MSYEFGDDAELMKNYLATLHTGKHSVCMNKSNDFYHSSIKFIDKPFEFVDLLRKDYKEDTITISHIYDANKSTFTITFYTIDKYRAKIRYTISHINKEQAEEILDGLSKFYTIN